MKQLIYRGCKYMFLSMIGIIIALVVSFHIFDRWTFWSSIAKGVFVWDIVWHKSSYDVVLQQVSEENVEIESLGDGIIYFASGSACVTQDFEYEIWHLKRYPLCSNDLLSLLNDLPKGIDVNFSTGITTIAPATSLKMILGIWETKYFIGGECNAKNVVFVWGKYCGLMY